MTYTGGRRYRLIFDSLYHMLHDSLEELGWFEAHSSHSPLLFPYEGIENDTQVPFNTLALSDEDISDWDAELGSNMGEITWTMYVDFYAESKPIGVHVINDIRDILQGRMPAIGRSHAVLEVLDYSLATPVEIFYCGIEDVMVDKAQNFPDAYRKNWYTCRFTVVDHYGG